MLFSIIIPVYNILDYIEECVKSCVGQCGVEDYEIVLIDDGSTDGSSIVCDRLSSEYKRVKAFHKENGGLSDARNYGVEKAKGEYIVFLDGDDYIGKNALKSCMDKITEAKKHNIDLDVVIADGQFFDTVGDIRREQWYDLEYANKKFPFTSGVELLRYTLSVRCNWAAWGKFIKREYWERNKYYFVKNRYSEDMQLIDKVILNAGHACMIPAFVYYRYRSNSIVNTVSAEHIFSIIENLSDWEEYFHDVSVDKYIRQRISKNLANSYLRVALVNVFMIKNEQDREKALEVVKTKIHWLHCLDTFEGKIVLLSCYLLGVRNTCKLLSTIKNMKKRRAKKSP